MTDIHVLIADDHPIVCKGIRILLDAAMGIEVVGETVNGQQALAMVESLPPDVLLLDMQLPDMSGVEVLRKLMEKPSSVRVLSLSSHDDHAYISQMLPLGSSGYLIKDEAPKLIVDAVRGVAGGEKWWVSRKVAARLSQMINDGKEGGKYLTIRELDVLRLVVEGKTSAEIAVRLGIGGKTVEKHLDGIFKKMNVASRVDAAVLAIRENYVWR